MKPEPISKFIVCSACGMPWDKHGPKPTLEKCIELLKEELARRPKMHQLYTSSGGFSGSYLQQSPHN